ncbi:TrbI F-type domain-containing protein [Vibrio cyclitrophicus]|uniref:Type-F conjugative transfer system protein TrbI n=2 Tax=Vibrio cyclitrophicus TaxID=47951 RepID=A0A7Z1S394_9VIBR|nr:TrbI F-type domain-containing protein [Vibrio cyclitrophicus]PMP21135.1 hypothetical protein BCS91_20605 [Vibrio cyclitrophicus]PMP30518.1 hypothetical protein BCS90_14545 [Vibrio cyclitrophicus]
MRKGLITHMATALFSITLSVTLTLFVLSKQVSIVTVDPKRLINDYQQELAKTSKPIEWQADRLVRFTQVMEQSISDYAQEHSVTVLVSPAVASHELDITSDIRGRIIQDYREGQ